VLQLHDFRPEAAQEASARGDSRLASTEATLHTILSNLAVNGSSLTKP
jgi:hypothetical protein